MNLLINNKFTSVEKELFQSYILNDDNLCNYVLAVYRVNIPLATA